VPNDIASQATWQINSSSQGNKKLLRVQSWDVGDEGSVEAVLECGSTVPVGFEVKPGALTISFEIKETKGTRREVNWEKLRNDREVIGLTKQVKGGLRTQYPECMVSKIDYNGEAEGALMYTVEIVALEQKAL
jgi:hypothetical protein